MQKPGEGNSASRRRQRALLNLFLWPIGLLLIAILCLILHQFILAGILTAFAIYFAATRTVPSVISRSCPILISRSKFREAEKLALFGIAYCKFLKIGSIGNLPRSLSWDNLLKSHLAQVLLQQGRFAESVQVNLEILRLLEAERDFVGAANVSGKLAYCYIELGQISKASSLMERVVPVLEAAANNADEKLARAYRARLCMALFEQATVLETKRDFDGAEVVRRKAADLSISMDEDNDHFKSMGHLSMLGKLLIRLEKYDEAERILDNVLAVRVKRLPPGSVLIASTKQGLGRLYCATSRLAQAETYLQEALEAIEKIAEGKHPDLPDYKGDLAKLRIKQTRYAEAESLIMSAIEQKERNGGKDHPALIDYLLDLSDLKRKMGHITEAESAHERADKILARLA
jgi:tetratricopeptide (TPR) repeat protein